ncbi:MULTISPECIES: ABC transporter substrate-binding protein [Pantoea]|jgi:iron complex transport system substrate-binding protein|uniref:ABC transporter substrate-binding protein n=1 Tax=Pantoea eucrina TaxID=472693 RepID=A0ABS1ZA08_9GAMM|nr:MULTISPECIES: ABC transporter substrate-binding protein [Pantoea]AJA71206.1 ABC transporter substrate-binding protein [Pantoea sp. PSNIH1]QNH53107.1 ABC transporter substrate-binding protein [Acinetobacter venetianus]MBM0749275.1 ABC transporter substrate-binding protein [Pantoea eucrina]MCL9648592.1 ABC transporter substrate-binding protein [Pantoea eucrina]MDJ0023358.1 ABC transporter substrate-binding protein [Pantoea eucrina]
MKVICGVALSLGVALSASATTYPLTITDLDGQQHTFSKEPRHIILQDGRDVLTLALLDRDNPFERIVAWNNLPKKQDTQTWEMLKARWPQAEKIVDMGFNDQGQVNLESVLAQQPDVMIAQLRAKPALIQSGVVRTLENLHIPVVFVDYELHPAQNTAKSVSLLGQILNREEQARDYTTFYQQKMSAITNKVSGIEKKPTVFIEPIAGNSDNCCFTHSHNGWGGLVEAVGGKNIGSALLPGNSGFVSLEKIIAMKPDVYIMTGSKRPNSNVLPFGYGVKPQEVTATFQTLTRRTGVAQIEPVKQNRAYGIYHHFYNHPWNIIGMEILAKDLYPQQFAALNPVADYHQLVKTFTHLPDDAITLSYPDNN